MEVDCCICFEPTQHRLLPCKHSVCQTCFAKLWRMKKTLCPMCKQVVICQNSYVVMQNTHNTITTKFKPGVFPGITICDTKDGVLISKINKSDACYTSGLRKGNIITHINNMSCNIGQKHVCQIFETASQRGIQLDCSIKPSKNIQFLTQLKLWTMVLP